MTNLDNHYGLRFQSLAEDLFESTGFEREGTHRFTRSPHGGHYSLFASDRGLYLAIGFEPLDGNYADIGFGRLWLKSGEFFALSCKYHQAARKFGYSVPATYTLGYSDVEVDDALLDICKALELSLRTIMEEIGLPAIRELEREKFGAENKAMHYFKESHRNEFSTLECSL